MLRVKPKWGLDDIFKTCFPPVVDLCSGGQKAFVSLLLPELA